MRLSKSCRMYPLEPRGMRAGATRNAYITWDAQWSPEWKPLPYLPVFPTHSPLDAAPVLPL